ncbi:hypothetical protein D9M73_106850 [compost metagenome]
MPGRPTPPGRDRATSPDAAPQRAAYRGSSPAHAAGSPQTPMCPTGRSLRAYRQKRQSDSPRNAPAVRQRAFPSPTRWSHARQPHRRNRRDRCAAQIAGPGASHRLFRAAAQFPALGFVAAPAARPSEDRRERHPASRRQRRRAARPVWPLAARAMHVADGNSLPARRRRLRSSARWRSHPAQDHISQTDRSANRADQSVRVGLLGHPNRSG